MSHARNNSTEKMVYKLFVGLHFDPIEKSKKLLALLDKMNIIPSKAFIALIQKDLLFCKYFTDLAEDQRFQGILNMDNFDRLTKHRDFKAALRYLSLAADNKVLTKSRFDVILAQLELMEQFPEKTKALSDELDALVGNEIVTDSDEEDEQPAPQNNSGKKPFGM
jgi:hypothetical protein